MTPWSDNERSAITTFADQSSILRTALEKFLEFHRDQCRELCAVNMAVVPRNPETASDYAAKAQAYDEFWNLLAEDLASA